MMPYEGVTKRIADPAAEIRANRGRIPPAQAEDAPAREPVIIPATPLPVAEPMSEQPKGRTSENLREILFDTLRALKEGRADPRQAIATAKIAQAIIDSVKVEIQFAQAAADARMPAPVPIKLAPPEDA